MNPLAPNQQQDNAKSTQKKSGNFSIIRPTFLQEPPWNKEDVLAWKIKWKKVCQEVRKFPSKKLRHVKTRVQELQPMVPSRQVFKKILHNKPLVPAQFNCYFPSDIIRCFRPCF